MLTADFRYDLPPELIAQQPATRRDGSRLLVLSRKTGKIEHRMFLDLLDFLLPGDVLVLNNSRVIPARLHGKNSQTGGQFEILLLEETAVNDWWAMMRPGKRARPGTRIQLLDKSGASTKFFAEVIDFNDEGHRRLRFSETENIFNELDQLGELPLPPYIERQQEIAADKERYQTVFSQPAGSVAAPTAGLHFTPEVLEKIRALGVKICFVTLHVGAGTFLPIKVENIAEHKMHSERFEIGAETVSIVNEAKNNGRRVIAIGTTATRALETTARLNAGKLNIHAGKTDIFLFPPANFLIVDALLTNFHLPESTLLMLVSAFAAPGEKMRGRELILTAYAEAVRERYRFFSYGDAMLIIMSEKSNKSRAKKPFVFINMAMTADGKIATANRAVHTFGSARDLRHLYELRATADAILCGARTVEISDSIMGNGGETFRKQRLKNGLGEYNLRVIATGSGSIDPGAKIFRHRFSPIIVLTTRRAPEKKLRRLRELADEIKICGETEIDFAAALRWLRAKWNVKRLLCEGGGELNDALFQADLVDEINLTLCPKIFGGRHAPTISDGQGFAKLALTRQFRFAATSAFEGELFTVLSRA